MYATSSPKDSSQCGYHALIGQSPAMRLLVERLPAIANARRTTLICGPTGSGKEVVARALHAHATRETPYVAVHCGALPEQLFEAELFGHTKGAFTGATQARPGLIRTASGGTLFLDEIDSLTGGAQIKLLRFLETGEYRAVGSDRLERADAWVLAATNRDLAESVRRREFREDLMYRLDVMRVELPPLRLRGCDAELLAAHFLHQALGPGYSFTDDALAAIRNYDWPGNVRELKHRVERAALLCQGKELASEALGFRARPFSSTPPPGEGEPLVSEPASLARELWKLIDNDGQTLGQAVEHCERLLIQAALRAEAENRTRAANRLGIHVRTIFKKLRAPGHTST
jgi:DNA-binding NtrC family response regulator